MYIYFFLVFFDEFGPFLAGFLDEMASLLRVRFLERVDFGLPMVAFLVEAVLKFVLVFALNIEDSILVLFSLSLQVLLGLLCDALHFFLLLFYFLVEGLHVTLKGHLLLEDISLSASYFLAQSSAVLFQPFHFFFESFDIRSSHK